MSPEPTEMRGPAGGQAVAFSGDRLGDLPDGLLHTIMSFLPAPQVVRTSVLSRRWRDLWRSIPCINIEESEFWTTPTAGKWALAVLRSDVHERQETWRKLEDFTTNLLLFHINVTSLEKFRIFSCGRPGTELHRREMDRWVRRGIKYCPQVLEIIIFASPPLPFPHMGASSCRLRRLHLCHMYLDNHFGDLLFSRCPVLEDLDLVGCNIDFQEIKSPTLKKLVIDRGDNLTGDPVVITAPHIAYLKLCIPSGCYSNGIFMCEMASLAKASINLLCLGETFALKHQRRLLGNLCNVRNLALCGFQTVAILVEESFEFPIFANLQTLSFERCFLDKCEMGYKLEALATFVQNAPCLEKLTLECCMFEVEMETEEQLVRENIILQGQDQNTYRCPKLKFIEVMYEEDHDHQLVELLWGIGRKLPGASIKLTKT